MSLTKLATDGDMPTITGASHQSPVHSCHAGEHRPIHNTSTTKDHCLCAGAAAEGSLQPAGASKGGQPGRERPKRSAQEWRPEPLLCKRLNVPDPFKGRPRELTMSRFRTDHLVLPDTDLQAASTPAAPLPLPPPPALPSTIPIPAVGTIASRHTLPQSSQPVQQGQGPGAAGMQAAGQDVQDAKALADSFLASLGLHASLAEPSIAGPSASAAPNDPMPAAAGPPLRGRPADQQQYGGSVLPSSGASSGVARVTGGDEVVAPDVVTAAALERRAALHKSIFEGDMESESDDEEGGEEEEVGVDTAPAMQAAAGRTQPLPAPQQPPLADPAGALPVSIPLVPNKPEAITSASEDNGTASVQQDAGGSGQSVLGLPTGMQKRPVFMSKKARLAQAAAQQAAASVTAAPSVSAPAEHVQPEKSRQWAIGPGRGGHSSRQKSFHSLSTQP